MIKGFLGSIRPFQVRGWALDTDAPEKRLTIELWVSGKSIATGKADMLREDLQQAGHGDGRYGFVINVQGGLPITAPELIEVRAIGGDGRWVGLPKIKELQIENPHPASTKSSEASTAEAENAKTSIIKLRAFPSASEDRSQRPVFILGAARSGTSAVLQALEKATRYEGYGEGHLLDIVTPLVAAVRSHYRSRAAEWQLRSTMMAAVAEDFFIGGIRNLLVEMARALYPTGWWLDKTPRPEMIAAAPFLRTVWPESRFIFMKRRALENVASRTRKFVFTEFADQCKDWTRSMETWGAVREQLKGAAVEIDQLYLARHPQEVAAALKDFLLLTAEEHEKFIQALATDHPERTSDRFGFELSLEDLNWSDEQRATFSTLCEQTMLRFGYDNSKSYFRPGDESAALVRL